MSAIREAIDRLGKVGIVFLIGIVLYFLFYFTGHGLWALLVASLLLPFAFTLAFRALRLLKRRGLWSVRSRLLCVYGLFGLLPLLLVIVLVGFGAWALTNELAIYLATTALDRRVESVQSAVEALRRMPPEQRLRAAPEIVRAFNHTLPGIMLHLRDAGDLRRFPPDTPALNLPAGWKNVSGILIEDGRYYAWAHFADEDTGITALAPLSDEMVENLVPHLGAISLLEGDTPKKAPHPAAVGAFRSLVSGGVFDDPSLTPELNPGHVVKLPPAAFRFDIPVAWPSSMRHYHLDSPNQTFGGVLWIYSRPSAVLGSFFSGTERLRGALFDSVVVAAFLFLLVELVAIFIGIGLSRRLTGAVNALYEGTRRVIFGDFTHRIPVRSHDQLGELAQSFNQMTGNLERLLVIEKEKERMQTELEIASEVQGQLYPKQAPPICGLKLTVQCDPARMVSGDYYDYQELAGNRLCFAIGDVAGKGISAALLMATLQAALRAQLTQYQPMRESGCSNVPEIDVSHLVSALNKQIFAHTSPEKYATFFFALFDERTRTLTYTNAGHLSPLLIRKDDVTPLDSNGLVVGAFPFAQYDESCVVMNPGDLLVCYTDGITEPENAYGEEFGEKRLVELVKQHSQREDSEIIHIVLEAVRSWTGVPELHDDMTLLLAREIQPV